jgi:hypothetical protein
MCWLYIRYIEINSCDYKTVTIKLAKDIKIASGTGREQRMETLRKAYMGAVPARMWGEVHTQRLQKGNVCYDYVA